MNFFSVDSSSAGGHLKTSQDIWIYFVVAVPLTTIVLCLWRWWQKREEKQANITRPDSDLDLDVEMQDLRNS